MDDEPGVALWLCPKKHTGLYEKLETVMASLQTLFPGTPPSFEPHITISTNIDIALQDPEKRHDDVDRILSASVAALQSIPHSTETNSPLVRLGRINSQRPKFKKLYFEVARDANLVSFARVIRELFVVMPQLVERENKTLNPHLYTTDSSGNLVRRSKLRSKRRAGNEAQNNANTKEVDVAPLQSEASALAANWTRSEFSPHLSLVYSDVYPIGSAMWRTIRTRVQDYLGIENCDDPTVIDTGLGWDGGVLKLVWCRGDVQDWIELGSVDV